MNLAWSTLDNVPTSPHYPISLIFMLICYSADNDHNYYKNTVVYSDAAGYVLNGKILKL